MVLKYYRFVTLQFATDKYLWDKDLIIENSLCYYGVVLGQGQ
jgi:hypothetical protein